MIRLLSEVDRAATVTLLNTAPYFNLYMLGNLEKLGFDRDFCEFWGDFDSVGTLRGVINRYMAGWSIWGNAGADWPGLGTVLDNHPMTGERLQDNPGGVASFVPYLRRYIGAQEHIEELMEMQHADFQPMAAPAGVTIRRGSMTDHSALVQLYADAGGMARTAASVERPLKDTRLWLAEADGEILSAALTNAEIANAAMIGGVYTPPSQRGRGLSQAVCSALCADLLAVGKQPVLYWDNPAAGRVYRKLGFQARGQWRAVWLQK